MKIRRLMTVVLSIIVLTVQPIHAEVKDNVGGMDTSPVDNTYAAGAARILEDYSAWVNGEPIIGTMKNYSNQSLQAAGVTSDSSNTYLTVPKAGYYSEGTKVYTANSNLSKNQPATSPNIVHVGGLNVHLCTEACWTTSYYNKNLYWSRSSSGSHNGPSDADCTITAVDNYTISYKATSKDMSYHSMIVDQTTGAKYFAQCDNNATRTLTLIKGHKYYFDYQRSPTNTLGLSKGEWFNTQVWGIMNQAKTCTGTLNAHICKDCYAK